MSTYKVNGMDTFGTGTFPGRKNPCLFMVRDQTIYPVAWFRCEDDAREFEAMLEELFRQIGHPVVTEEVSR